MTKPRARWPNGSMANCLQKSPHAPQIQTHVPTQPNSSFSEDNDNTTDPPDDSPGQPITKRKRGPSKPYIDWRTEKKLIVELNSFNQPIGETASKLESQLGVIARNAIYCPITYTDWRCKGIDKERIWQDVQDNCEVSKVYKKNCLKSVGDKWRKWRGRLTKEHYSIFDNDEERLANVPRGVDSDQWKLFVQYKGSDMAKDALNTKLQEVHETQHTLELREKVFIDVFGPDTHGRVRSLGRGPCPTEVFGKQDKQSCEKHARDLERARQEGLEEGLKKNADRLERVEKMLEIYLGTKVPKYPTEKVQISDAQSSQHQSVDSSEFLFDVGMKVQLLNVGLPKKVVAEGYIVSQDPMKKIAGVPIGDGFWEVRITKAILPCEDLLIGRSKMRKVGHAIKQNVPWRKLDIKQK